MLKSEMDMYCLVWDLDKQ